MRLTDDLTGSLTDGLTDGRRSGAGRRGVDGQEEMETVPEAGAQGGRRLLDGGQGLGARRQL